MYWSHIHSNGSVQCVILEMDRESHMLAWSPTGYLYSGLDILFNCIITTVSISIFRDRDSIWWAVMWDHTGCNYRIRWSRSPLCCTMITSRSFRWYNWDRCYDLQGWMGWRMTQWSRQGVRWDMWRDAFRSVVFCGYVIIFIWERDVHCATVRSRGHQMQITQGDTVNYTHIIQLTTDLILGKFMYLAPRISNGCYHEPVSGFGLVHVLFQIH